MAAHQDSYVFPYESCEPMYSFVPQYIWTDVSLSASLLVLQHLTISLHTNRPLYPLFYSSGKALLLSHLG